MIGALAFIAMSWILTIFWAWVSDSEPPNTVKSLANTKVLRPLTVPQPVTTPSPGTLVFSMPNSVERCSTNMSNSSNDPLSSSSSMRSRAVSFPRACCASMRFSPPPSLAPARRSSRVSRISFMWCFPVKICPGSNTAFCRRETPLRHLAPLPQRRYIPCLNGGDVYDGYPGRGNNRRRNRRITHPAPAGRAHAVYRYDAALRGLGRIVVDLRHSVPGARSQLRGLSVGAPARCHHLQHGAQLHGPDDPDDRWVCPGLAAGAFDRDDLARAYRHRPRARLWPEIQCGIWLHPSWPRRQRRGEDLIKLAARPPFVLLVETLLVETKASRRPQYAPSPLVGEGAVQQLCRR